MRSETQDAAYAAKITIYNFDDSYEQPCGAASIPKPMSSLDTTLVAGRYDAYKRATERFLKWLRSAVPRVKIPPVESMVEAAREFATRGEPAPASIIKDLEKCIAVRTAVHELYTAHAVVESASDRGHGYFIQVLGCVQKLACVQKFES